MRQFRYKDADYEQVPCNICGSSDCEVIAQRDRNRLRVTSVICRVCGLIYITPRMTPAWYSRYYEHEYRRQMAAHHGRDLVESPEQRFAKQVRRGNWLSAYLRRNGITSPGRILDIGSSTGGLLFALQQAFGAEVRGVEPSPSDAVYAEARGVPTTVGLFEEYAESHADRFDLILCSQTFNHLLNPRAVSEHVRNTLRPGGAFFVECMDFIRQCQSKRAVYEATQIDHVYMFVPSTLESLLQVAGFDVLPDSVMVDRLQSDEVVAEQRREGVPSTHMRMLARPGQPTTQPTSTYAKVSAELATLPNSQFGAWLHRQRRTLRRFRYRVGDRVRGWFLPAVHSGNRDQTVSANLATLDAERQIPH